MRFLIIACISSCFAVSASAGTVKANIDMQRGSIVQPGDISVEAVADADLIAVMDKYVGKEVKRSINAGTKLNPSYVGKPVIVERNSRVTMIYKAGRMEITAWGRALGEGGVDDIISVMNLDSRKRVQGRVLESGDVEVGL